MLIDFYVGSYTYERDWLLESLPKSRFHTRDFASNYANMQMRLLQIADLGSLGRKSRHPNLIPSPPIYYLKLN